MPRRRKHAPASRLDLSATDADGQDLVAAAQRSVVKTSAGDAVMLAPAISLRGLHAPVQRKSARPINLANLPAVPALPLPLLRKPPKTAP